MKTWFIIGILVVSPILSPLLLNWPLVAVAILGVIVAVRTLNTLRQQTDATRIAAEAAKASADSVKIGQRATIMADFPAHPDSGFVVGGRPTIRAEIRNIGPTVARHCRYNVWTELLAVPFVDFTPQKEIYEAPFQVTIFPNANSPTIINVTLDRPLTDSEMVSIISGARMFCFRIHIDYEDVFGNVRWSEFGNEFNGQVLGALPKYNDSD